MPYGGCIRCHCFSSFLFLLLLLLLLLSTRLFQRLHLVKSKTPSFFSCFSLSRVIGRGNRAAQNRRKMAEEDGDEAYFNEDDDDDDDDVGPQPAGEADGIVGPYKVNGSAAAAAVVGGGEFCLKPSARFKRRVFFFFVVLSVSIRFHRAGVFDFYLFLRAAGDTLLGLGSCFVFQRLTVLCNVGLFTKMELYVPCRLFLFSLSISLFPCHFRVQGALFPPRRRIACLLHFPTLLGGVLPTGFALDYPLVDDKLLIEYPLHDST